MKNNYKKILQFVFFLLLGLFILWWLYKDQNPQDLLRILKEDVRYGWLILALFIGLLSHVSRTIRWQMMIEPLGKRPNFINTFLSVLIGYLANLAIPRMGEVSRCAVLSKHENISFTKLLGSVVAERALDVISMLVSLLLVLVFQGKILLSLSKRDFNFSEVRGFFTTPTPYIIALLIVGGIYLFRNRIKKWKFLFKIKELWRKFKEGFLSFKDIKSKPSFIFHSILIFFFYFLMMYVNFLAFSFTEHLSGLAGLTVFVFGTLAMVAPVQGGIGPWHFMVITSLMAYGIGANEAGIFALIVHGALNLMIVIFGLISMLILPFLNSKSKE